VLYDRSYEMRMGEVKLPGGHIYMVNQPDLVQRIMVSEYENFPKHPLQGEILSPLLGESLFTTNGAQWKKQREMLKPSFEMVRIQHVFGLMNDAASDMMKRLEREEGREMDIDSEMTYVTADIIFRTILSVRLDSDEARKIFDAFVLFQEESPKTALLTMYRLPRWLRWGPAERRRQSAGAAIRAAIEAVVRPRYDAVTRGEEGNYQDILSSMLPMIDPDTGKRFALNEIVDQISMLFLAGHETSASALTWSIYLLSLAPEVQEKAHAEAQEVFDKEGVSVSSVKSLSLVRDVFREALRLYPPVGFFPRECTVATAMRDKHLKAGAMMLVSPWLIHRHREYWENPNGFDPERFSQKDRMKMPLKDIYMPFGMGPRICIGASFALQEAALILATVLKTYKVTLAKGFEPRPVARLTIRSENGMRVVLHRREA